MNAWANLHLLGHPNTFLVTVLRVASGGVASALAREVLERDGTGEIVAISNRS